MLCRQENSFILVMIATSQSNSLSFIMSFKGWSISAQTLGNQRCLFPKQTVEKRTNVWFWRTGISDAIHLVLLEFNKMTQIQFSTRHPMTLANRYSRKSYIPLRTSMPPLPFKLSRRPLQVIKSLGRWPLRHPSYLGFLSQIMSYNLFKWVNIFFSCSTLVLRHGA